MVLVKKTAVKSSQHMTAAGSSDQESISNPYGNAVNSIHATNNPYLDTLTSKGSRTFFAPPESTGADLTSAGSNFVLDSNAGTFTVLSPNNNYIPSVQSQTTKKPFVRLPPVPNGFAPVSYSMASIGSSSMASSPFLVTSSSSANGNLDPLGNPYSAGDTLNRQYVISPLGDGNNVAATNNPYLDAVVSKGTASNFVLSQGQFISTGDNTYLSPPGNNVGSVSSPYSPLAGSSVNYISSINNPYLDAVTSKDSNSYSLLPRSTSSGIASATNNIIPDSNKETFSTNHKRMVFPTVATTARNPFLTSSKATFRPTTRPTTTTTVPTAPPAPAINPFLSMSTTKPPLKIRQETFTRWQLYEEMLRLPE